MLLRGIITLALAAGLCACDLALDLSAFEGADGAGGTSSDDTTSSGAGGSEPLNAPCPQEELAGAETWICTSGTIARLASHGDTLFWLAHADKGQATLHRAQLSDDSSTDLGTIDGACGLVARSESVFVRTQTGAVLSLAVEDGALQHELGREASTDYGDHCDLAADDTRVVWFDARSGRLLQADPALSQITTVQEGIAFVSSLELSAGGVLWVGRLVDEIEPTVHYSRAGNAVVTLQLDGEPCSMAFDGSDALITLQGAMVRWDPEQPQSQPASVLSTPMYRLCRLATNGSHTVVTTRNRAKLFIVPPGMPQNMPQELDASGDQLTDVALVGDTVVWAPHQWKALVRYALP